jgi:hypothetical protein
VRWVAASFLIACVHCSAQAPELQVGSVLFRPGGFFDLIGEYRSQTTQDTVSTRYARLPLSDTPSESLASIAHSRLQLHVETPVEGARLVGYIEADFLPPPGEPPWRWRQYWVELRARGWRLLGGQSWSLLRPNRKGISTESDLMNTAVVDPAYHLGLAGVRRRALRLTRELGASAVAVEWASMGEFLAKAATDVGAGHFEVMGGVGTRDRIAAGLAQVVHATPHINLVGQQLWTQGFGPQLLGFAPPGVHTLSTIEGIEANITPDLLVFGYGGIVYGSRSPGNRLGRQWAAGFQHRVFADRAGSLHLAAQFSQVDRSVWSGAQGYMWYWMTSARFTVASW